VRQHRQCWSHVTLQPFTHIICASAGSPSHGSFGCWGSSTPSDTLLQLNMVALPSNALPLPSHAQTRPPPSSRTRKTSFHTLPIVEHNPAAFLLSQAIADRPRTHLQHSLVVEHGPTAVLRSRSHPCIASSLLRKPRSPFALNLALCHPPALESPRAARDAVSEPFSRITQDLPHEICLGSGFL
jgi:hypothetical protein